MTYYLIVGGTTQQPLASTTGWYDFKVWTDGLNVETYPQLIHLIDWGWSQELDALILELKLALAVAKPAATTVEATLRSLLDSLIFSEDAHSVFVSDGLGASDPNQTAAEAQEEYDFEYVDEDEEL